MGNYTQPNFVPQSNDRAKPIQGWVFFGATSTTFGKLPFTFDVVYIGMSLQCFSLALISNYPSSYQSLGKRRMKLI